MRNLSEELTEFNLHRNQIKGVLKWINTLTNQDLKDNGSDNWLCGPPGDGDYENFIEPTRDERIQVWIEDNLCFYKEISDVTRGRLSFVKDLKYKFDLTLKEAKSHLDKNW